MTGSLQIKKGLYFIILNTYDIQGKRKQKWISTGLVEKGNKKRAEKLLRDTISEHESQVEQEVKSDLLFADAIRQWLKASAIRVDAVTLQGYEALTRVHILPYFDDLQIKLVEVDRHVLQKYIDEKFRNGRKDGKGGLSPTSLRLHKNVLYQTLTDAVLNELISSNPCEYVTLPPMLHFEQKFYSAEKLTSLFEAIKDEPLYPLVKITTVYGLRRSEVLGLKWDSIDFEGNLVTIRHTVSKVSKVVEKDKTKSASSRRSFPLLPEIKVILLDLKRNEAINKRLFGKQYIQNDYIFKWDTGNPYSPDFVSHKFDWLLKHYGFSHIRFHELRHSCASILIAKGFNLKDVQEWLGHADIKMTANIYSHLDVTRKQGMADRLGSSFSSEL